MIMSTPIDVGADLYERDFARLIMAASLVETIHTAACASALPTTLPAADRRRALALIEAANRFRRAWHGLSGEARKQLVAPRYARRVSVARGFIDSGAVS
jgi:hypothetical protein